MKKLIIFFPGVGYAMDCPLLYYADFIYETNGFDRIYLNYQSILSNADLTLHLLKRPFHIAIVQVMWLLEHKIRHMRFTKNIAMKTELKHCILKMQIIH